MTTMLRTCTLPSRAAKIALQPQTNCPQKLGRTFTPPRDNLWKSQRRAFGSSPRCRDKGSKDQSFKGQLYESTQQRLKRERAEQARFSSHQRESPGGRYAAITFSRDSPLKLALAYRL